MVLFPCQNAWDVHQKVPHFLYVHAIVKIATKKTLTCRLMFKHHHWQRHETTWKMSTRKCGKLIITLWILSVWMPSDETASKWPIYYCNLQFVKFDEYHHLHQPLKRIMIWIMGNFGLEWMRFGIVCKLLHNYTWIKIPF